MSQRAIVGGLLAVLSLPLSAQQSTGHEPHHLVQVFIRDASSLDVLMGLDLDLAACTALELPAKLIDVIATEADIATLARSGLEFDVAIRDLEEHHARDLARFGGTSTANLTPPVGSGGMGGHYTLAQMEAILDSFRNDHPTICAQKVSIGQSLEGRDIWMVKISDNVGTDESEPEMYYDSVHHAREPLGMTTTLQFMDELLSGYGSDPEATFIIDNRELYFVPCVNPDGYEYNRSTNPGGGGLWRKNRRGDQSSTWGVDLNRNYVTGWNAPNGGNSTNRSSETYRGTAPFSEPETQAVRDFLAARNVTQVNSCHTYTEILLRPWGYQNGNPPNNAEYLKVGDRLTAENGLQHGSASDLLYIAAGTTLDHAHVINNALGWTPELGRSSEGGFWPNPPNQIAIANRHQHMFRQMALTAGPLLAIGATTLSEAPGGNGNGTVDPGESGLLVVTVSNDGLLATSSGQLTLSAISSGVTIQNGTVNLPAIPRLGTTNNLANPLRFSIPGSYTDPFVQLRLTLTGDGRTSTADIRLLLASLRVAVETDMEADHGFSRGATTARTGAWERADPARTTSGNQTIQPGDDHTPGAGTMCWITDGRAGSSAGTYDVDAGYTELLSPVFDLAHLAVAEVHFWRWYAESQSNDAFELFVRNSPSGSWTRMLQSSSSTGAWVDFRAEIPVALTDQVQFRIRAQDNNASLVEAGIDDFGIDGVMPDASLTLMSSGTIGTTLRAGMNGQNGATGTLLASPGRVSPITIPGIQGVLELDPTLIIVLPAVPFGTVGYADFDIDIPNAPSLRGSDLFFQVLQTASGSNFRLGNTQRVLFN